MKLPVVTVTVKGEGHTQTMFIYFLNLNCFQHFAGGFSLILFTTMVFLSVTFSRDPYGISSSAAPAPKNRLQILLASTSPKNKQKETHSNSDQQWGFLLTFTFHCYREGAISNTRKKIVFVVFLFA